MTPATIRQIGRLLYVPLDDTAARAPLRDSHWQTPMSIALDTSPRYLRLVLTGHRPVPGDWPDRIREIARRRVAETMRAHEMACGEGG